MCCAHFIPPKVIVYHSTYNLRTPHEMPADFCQETFVCSSICERIYRKKIPSTGIVYAVDKMPDVCQQFACHIQLPCIIHQTLNNSQPNITIANTPVHIIVFLVDHYLFACYSSCLYLLITFIYFRQSLDNMESITYTRTRRQHNEGRLTSDIFRKTQRAVADYSTCGLS